MDVSYDEEASSEWLAALRSNASTRIDIRQGDLLDGLHSQRSKNTEAISLETIEVSFEIELSHRSLIVPLQIKDLEVAMSTHPPAYKVIDPSDNGEEAAFKVQGILCAKDLPPVQPL
jgi:hypothetical protein